MHSSRKPPSISKINEYLSYEKETGQLFWKYKKYSKDKAGKEVGTLNELNYRRFTFLTKSYYVHQIVFYIETKDGLFVLITLMEIQ